MKLLVTLSAACSCLVAYSSGAFAADASAEASTASVDPSVSGMLPSESNEGKPAAAPGTDKEVGKTSEAAATHDRDAKNALYLDLLGPGLLYSINYDREIADDVAVRIGFSYLSYGASRSDGGTTVGGKFSYFAIPVTVSYLGIGSPNNMLELGAGGEILKAKGDGFVNASEGSGSVSASRTFFAVTGLLGYRHQPADGGFVFRVGLSPTRILNLVTIPTGYLSLGAAF